jgi:hypothetical protein
MTAVHPNSYEAGREQLRRAIADDGGYHGLAYFLSHAASQRIERRMAYYVALLRETVTPQEQVVASAENAVSEPYEQVFERQVNAVREATGYDENQAIAAIAAFRFVNAAYPAIEISDVLPGVDNL